MASGVCESCPSRAWCFIAKICPKYCFRPGPVVNLRIRGVFDLAFPRETIFYATTTQTQCDTQAHDAIPTKNQEGQFVH